MTKNENSSDLEDFAALRSSLLRPLVVGDTYRKCRRLVRVNDPDLNIVAACLIPLIPQLSISNWGLFSVYVL